MLAKTPVHKADLFGDLKAEVAKLMERHDALKAELIAMGTGVHEGERYRVTVSKSERETLDMEAVRAKLSRQFIQANTNVTEVTTVRAVARKVA